MWLYLKNIFRKRDKKLVTLQLDMKHQEHHNEDKINGNSLSLNCNQNSTYTSSCASSFDQRSKKSSSSSWSHHHLTPAQINDLKKNYLGESSFLDAHDADESASKYCRTGPLLQKKCFDYGRQTVCNGSISYFFLKI